MTATMYPTKAHAVRPSVGVRPRTERRVNYAARRLMAALIVAIVVVLVAIAASSALGALLDVGARPVAATDLTTSPVVRIHVAQSGDTLWSIAEQYRGEVGQARFVDALIDVNGGTAIQVGQAVRLP